MIVPPSQRSDMTAYVPVDTNLFLFAAVMFLVHTLATRVAGLASAIAAICLLAFWPNSIFLTGLAAEEPLLLVLRGATA